MALERMEKLGTIFTSNRTAQGSSGVERSPPPFFKQNLSANARLLFFSLLAIGLLVVDSRLQR